MGMDDDNAGCGHVFIGQAEHTIVSSILTEVIRAHTSSGSDAL